MKYYVCRGHYSLVVTNMEPEPARYLAGPFPDHLDAFDWMQAAEKRQSIKRAAFQAVWPLVAIGIIGVLLK